VTSTPDLSGSRYSAAARYLSLCHLGRGLPPALPRPEKPAMGLRYQKSIVPVSAFYDMLSAFYALFDKKDHFRGRLL
jgi:hypothetical protein